ncbi:MAG: hypothetical protein NC320_09390 [Clostridium sp.]|nr:hypothetical protein [Clostridium sp.]
MKRNRLIIICLTALSVLVIIVFLKIGIKPTISYNKSMLVDNKNSFEIAAKICMNYYKESEATDDVWLFSVSGDINNLICYNNNERCLYSLTQEQRQAFTKVKSVFRLDHQGLEYLYVNDDFVVFGIINGRASFIYSPYNKKPNFVNSPKGDEDNIFVEKIISNWFYACKQS